MIAAVGWARRGAPRALPLTEDDLAAASGAACGGAAPYVLTYLAPRAACSRVDVGAPRRAGAPLATRTARSKKCVATVTLKLTECMV